VAKAFVKPYELIYNKATMPVPLTGQCRVIGTRLLRAERDILACGQGRGLQ
jgi:hypothetical protein